MNYLISGYLLFIPYFHPPLGLSAPFPPVTLMTQKISNNISFEDAIAQTQTLLEKMANKSISDEEIQITVTNLVQSENGARGFFVTYLVDERPFIDSPSASIIQSLQSSPTIVGELLVKNLAMSSAMMLTHRRNHDELMAQGSAQVRDRTLLLIKAVNLPTVTQKLQALEENLTTGQGQYQVFLERWKYDAEQKKVIQSVILELKDPKNHQKSLI